MELEYLGPRDKPLEHTGLALTSNDSWRNSRYNRGRQQRTLPRQQGPQSSSWAHFCFNIWKREENVISGHPASDQAAQEQSAGHRHELVLRGWEAGLSGLERLLLCICRETRADTRTFGSNTLVPFPTKPGRLKTAGQASFCSAKSHVCRD